MSDWRIGTVSQSQAEATPFASAGLCNLTRNLVANSLSSVTFEVQTEFPLTADLDFAYGSSYIIWKDTARWFYGRVTTIPRQGEPRSEIATITLADPWWYFQTAYMQSWLIYDVDGEVLVNTNKTRVVLFQDAVGARLTTGNQVADVIDWLIARGAPIAKGVIDAGIELPFDERCNISCGEVIDTVLRWTPDYVAWFDYTTTPYPTFNFRARANLTVVTKALTAINTLNPITPRYDLQKPGVEIAYEKTHSVDEQTFNTVELDTAGDTSAIDAVFASFDLQGSTRTYVKQKIVSEEYPASNSKTWWKKHVTWLNAIADADITIHDHAVDSDISGYHLILTDGTVQDWMTYAAIQSSIRAQADYSIRDGSGNVIEVKKNVEICATVVATDAVSNTYMRLTAFDSGESTPTGVAAALFAAWSVLHYDGSLTLIEEECAGTLVPGAVLRISGGRTEWATMDAIVQSCSENIDTGTSTIQFGPAARIEADSLVALFRAFRSRRYAWQASARASGDAKGSGEVSLSGSSKDTNQSSGGGETTKMTVTNTDGTNTHIVNLDPTVVTHADGADAAARTLQPRELLIPEMSGGSPDQLVLKRRQVMASTSYHANTVVGSLIRLSELNDVTITSIANDQVLKWSSSAGKWVNGTGGGGAGNAANPGAAVVTLGGNTEGSEAAASDTWTTGATNGLAVWKVCRVGYFHAGDKKLYAYVRLFTYDKNGQLYSVSAETRVEVDAAVAET